MNRRQTLFIALAVILPVAIFAVSKGTASWRPTPVGRLLVGRSGAHEPTIVFTGNRVVDRSSGTAFDVTTGVRTHAPRFNIVGQGAWTWQAQGGDNPRLILRTATARPPLIR